jgi:hypothetical protein
MNVRTPLEWNPNETMIVSRGGKRREEPMNPAYMAKCHCGQIVLKVRMGDNWYTLCDTCYRNSLPNLEVMTDEQLLSAIQIVRDTLGETEGIVKKFVDSMLVERVCRRL